MIYLIILVGIIQSYDTFKVFKFIISFPEIDFVTYLKENMLLGNRSFIVLMLEWFTYFILAFKTETSMFSSFVNGLIYSRQINGNSFESNSFEISETICRSSSFSVFFFFFHLFLSKCFYLCLTFYLMVL